MIPLLAVALIVTLALCRAAAPGTLEERECDDEAQAESLRHWKEQRA